MALPHQKFREIVFQLLYSHDFAESSEADMIPFLMEEHAVTKKSMREAHARKLLILGKLIELDGKLQQHAKEYVLDRIPGIEKNILRLEIFELLYDPEIPPKVAISEGVRLARKFATAESASFVNAILDSVYTELGVSAVCTSSETNN